jgi:hypothetical protein
MQSNNNFFQETNGLFSWWICSKFQSFSHWVILKEKNSGNFGKYKYITIMMNKKKCPNDATKLSTSNSRTRDAQYFSNPKHETTWSPLASRVNNIRHLLPSLLDTSILFNTTLTSLWHPWRLQGFFSGWSPIRARQRTAVDLHPTRHHRRPAPQHKQPVGYGRCIHRPTAGSQCSSWWTLTQLAGSDDGR